MSVSLPELYVAVDVETDGPIPGQYSMLSMGMAVVGHRELRFYSEIQPIAEEFQPQALVVSGLDRDHLLRHAPTPRAAMESAAAWINGLRKMGRPVFLAAPAVWDGMFVHWYFMNFLGVSPFGQTGSGIDLRSYWMGFCGCEWVDTRKGRIKQSLNVTDLPHTHHAGDDAAELAVLFERLLAARASAEKPNHISAR